ncbi:pyridoxamine 5'-phosphate oxidase family protein [Candidatus Albibeggiatoa sp. nov. NOAA]|uniref:pyridoxamine 5'-phosphate oxidase family protein n=1 Tax=Candidatus Albibeggiatoa sp. nov. NOAA TaxID=3162724 RepID=UPI0032FC8689|nr:pyridoxamine 5'-phosphate oxidase family protein [Thiotrichaceae bacterium]
MGQTFTALSDKHIEFIENQKIFFVGTAVDTGNVNISPKGGDSLRVVDANTIVWQNLTGSGNESATHVIRNPRMTIMFCAFEGKPLILRTYGNARVLHRNDAEWAQYMALFEPNFTARQIFILDISLVLSSCGMAVPFFDYQGDRDFLDKWAMKQGEEGIEQYWIKRNQKSLDGFDTEIVTRAGIKAASDE